jgi:hypothetical protein
MAAPSIPLQKMTAIIGTALIIVGILGFIPGALQHPHAADPDLSVTGSYGRLLGLFPVNVLHNLVHLTLGVWAVLASRNFLAARQFCRFNAVFYGALAVLGLLPGVNTLFGLVPIFSHDIWMHAALAAVTGYLGFSNAARTHERKHSAPREAA